MQGRQVKVERRLIRKTRPRKEEGARETRASQTGEIREARQRRR
jgi:hypothetical protein